MGKANLALARDHARDDLAAAIQAAADAEHTVEAARAAVARATDMVAQARERLDAAFAETARAKGEASARALTAATTGEALAPDGSMRTARLREIDAQDDLDACRAALTSAEATLAGPEEAARRAQKRVAEAAQEVMAGAPLDRILAEASALQERLSGLRAVLWFLSRECLDRESTERERQKIATFLAAPAYAWEFNGRINEHPALEPWRAARQALQTNADAPLPDVA